MDVRLLDADDEVALSQWYEALRAGWLYQRPWEIVSPIDAFAHLLRNPMVDQFHEGYVAYDGSRAVGAMMLTVATQSNSDKVNAEIAVAPAHRRRGAGTALLERAYRRTAELGAIYTQVPGSYSFADRDSHFTHAFARAVGLRLDLDEIQRRCELPIDPRLLAELREQAARHHQGYRIEVWDGEIPEMFLDSWLETQNLLAIDAPLGEVPYEKDSWTPEVWRDTRAYVRETGQQILLAVAISPDQEVVGVTDLVIRSNRTDVEQWGTIVRGEHRGHRLGLAIKAANLQYLAEVCPGARRIDTINAEVNDAMISVNETLGFRALAVHPMWYRKVA